MLYIHVCASQLHVHVRTVNVEILAFRKIGDFVKSHQKLNIGEFFNLAVAYPVSMTLCMYAKI